MHRIDHDTATVDDKFTGGDPSTGTPATIVTDDWLNAVQEEISGVIEGTGETLDKADNTQLATAIAAMIAAVHTGSLAGNGYLRIAGWLIIQWGNANTSATGGFEITFPIGFPTSQRGCYFQVSGNTDGAYATTEASATPKSSVIVHTWSDASTRAARNVNYLAVGY